MEGIGGEPPHPSKLVHSPPYQKLSVPHNDNIDRIVRLDPSVATWAELGYNGAESRTVG